MTYDLVIDLKNAGYPQMWKDIVSGGKIYAIKKGSGGIFLLSTNDISLYNDYEKEGIVYIPSLSELIEACGRRFACLTLSNDGTFTAMDYDTFGRSSHSIQGSGSTPEEAVANLWLELNKK